MRALSRDRQLVVAAMAAWVGFCGAVFGATIQNPEFEEGTLSGWTARPDGLTVEASTNRTFNRNYAARIGGTFASARWVTNSVSQTIPVNPGDKLSAEGFVFWKQHAGSWASATGFVEASLSGGFGSTSVVWGVTNRTWSYFHLGGILPGMSDGGFETASLDSWDVGMDGLVPIVQGDVVSGGHYALKLIGSWHKWSFNQLNQPFQFKAGDVVEVTGRINVKQLTASAGWALAGLKLELPGSAFGPESVIFASTNNTGWRDVSIVASVPSNGTYLLRCMICGDVTSNGTATAEVYFDDIALRVHGVEVANGGFESGSLTPWIVGCDHLVASATNTTVSEGAYALRLSGGWNTNWSFNQAYQPFHARSGTVIEARGKVNLQSFSADSGSPLAGIKLEKTDNTWAREVLFTTGAVKGAWLDVSITAAITNTGDYVFRCMICGGGSNVAADVFFDDLQLWEQGGSSGGAFDSNATLAVTFRGFSGGASHTSAVDVYVDGFTLNGSTAGIEPATNIYTVLKQQAAAIAADPGAAIPDVVYPPIFSFGYPGGDPTNVNYPAYIEAVMQGWWFRPFSNDVTLVATNSLDIYSIGTNGLGFIEFDQFSYVDKSWGTERGTPPDVQTNPPYFQLGARDNSSAEFGNGPFPEVHTYVYGTSLTNFPRRMTTDGSGGWPHTLRIVLSENFSKQPLSRDRYFVLATVPTNGPASNIKFARFSFDVSEPGHTNLAWKSQEIHMGWASESQSWGMLDYPNLTYQDHNLCDIRNGGTYNHAQDGRGWFVRQSPRGSATIEPMTLYGLKNGNWVQRIYEESLYMWPNAASGVRSIFDDDSQVRLDGRASYDISYKLAHMYSTNEYGEPAYWQLFEARGCAYYRMTDYRGVMAGSFRPMAANVFSFYGAEGLFLMPRSYTWIVPRTTPTNLPDNSYVEVYTPVQSATNQDYIGVIKTDFHFAPDEVERDGAYFDIEADTWANRAIDARQKGPLCLFAQSSMHWRGDQDFGIDNFQEGHDIDAVMVHKQDGEWITHQMINPPTNIFHVGLGPFGTGDVLYLQQQDRGQYTYGYTPEAPYQKASSFEISLFDDPGRDITVDIYQQHTRDEFADNIVIACNVNTNLALGEHLHSRYRYRTQYAPGVVIAAPNEPDGGGSWSNGLCRILVHATDGNLAPLKVDLYYGNGKDSGWTKINTGGALDVPTNTWTVAYDWDAAGVPPGAYYIKATATRTTDVVKVGFDISNTRLQIGSAFTFPYNTASNVERRLGSDLGFESGSTNAWNTSPTNWTLQADQVRAGVTNGLAAEGSYSCRMWADQWQGWSWNALYQEVPCSAGEWLHVTGRVYIASMESNAGWVVAGVKVETTNGGGSTSVEFTPYAVRGQWLDVDFMRQAAGTGTEKLMLFICGSGATNVNVYFDGFAVVSTNTPRPPGALSEAWWRTAGSPIDRSTDNLLRVRAAATYGYETLDVWAADSLGATNAVRVTNHAARLCSVPQIVDLPWSAFAGIDRTRIAAVGFRLDAPSNDVRFSEFKSVASPFRVTAAWGAAGAADLEGLRLFEPGDTFTNVITVTNLSATPLSGLLVQAVQEYAETRLWLDEPPGQPKLWSPSLRKGQRLFGAAEQRWTNVALVAGGRAVLTNVFRVPFGQRVKKLGEIFEPDWYGDRNYAGHCQTRLVIRTSAGDALLEQPGAGFYAIDDDFDLDDDGMTDAWETRHFGSRTGAAADDDSDGDGRNNLAEFIADTQPTNALSVPWSDIHISSSTNPAWLAFPTVTDRCYWVQWKPSLTQGQWTTLTNPVTGNDQVNAIMDSDSRAASNRFYRLLIRMGIEQ